MKKPQLALNRAVKIAGSDTALAAAIGTTPQLVRYWKRFAKNGASAAFAQKIEAATGVPRHELRPDIFKADAA